MTTVFGRSESTFRYSGVADKCPELRYLLNGK